MPQAKIIKRLVQRAVNRYGYDIVPHIPPDISAEEREIIELVRPFTMTSPERIAAVVSSVKYIVENRIEGDIVECGVWRGGSMMAALYTLQRLGDTQRTVYLFDTFAGMTEPNAKDVSFTGLSATELLARDEKTPSGNHWCWATIEDVRRNVSSVGYPGEKIKFVEGDVMTTVPDHASEKIALLRLDTDWYESTKHELIHLYPRLSQGGVLIIDDYGHWKGAREAVDEYFAARNNKPFLHRIDYTGRYLVKG